MTTQIDRKLSYDIFSGGGAIAHNLSAPLAQLVNVDRKKGDFPLERPAICAHSSRLDECRRTGTKMRICIHHLLNS